MPHRRKPTEKIFLTADEEAAASRRRGIYIPSWDEHHGDRARQGAFRITGDEDGNAVVAPASFLTASARFGVFRGYLTDEGRMSTQWDFGSMNVSSFNDAPPASIMIPWTIGGPEKLFITEDTEKARARMIKAERAKARRRREAEKKKAKIVINGRIEGLLENI